MADYSKLSNETLQKLHSGEAIDPTKLSNDELTTLYHAKQEQPAGQPSPEQPSQLEDLGSLFQKGAQLNMTPALKGIGSALGDVGGDLLFGLPRKDVEGYLKTYRDAQQKAQQEQSAALERNPVSGRIAEFAGGVVPGLIAGPALKAAPVLTGAGLGGIQAAGESKATIEGNPGQMALDTAFGGLLGGTLAKGASMIGSKAPAPVLSAEEEAAQAGNKVLTQNPMMAQLQTAKQLGQEGLTLSNKPAARAPLVQRLQQNVEDVSGQLLNPKEQLGKEISDSLQKAGNEGVVLTIKPEIAETILDAQTSIKDSASTLGRKLSSDLQTKLEAFRQGLLSPEEAYQLRKQLGTVYPRFQDSGMQGVIKDTMDAIKGSIEESVPEFGQKMANYNQFLKAGPESLLAGGHSAEIGSSLSELGNPEMQVAKKVESMLEGLRSGGQGEFDSYKGFQRMIDNLKELKESNPDLLKKIGLDPEKLETMILKKADEAAAIHGGSNVGLSELPTNLKGPLGIGTVGKGVALKGANMLGKGQAALGRFVDSKSLVNASTADLTNAAGTLVRSTNKQVQAMGKALSDAVAANDIQKRNAILFSILQTPTAKQELGIGNHENPE